MRHVFPGLPKRNPGLKVANSFGVGSTADVLCKRPRDSIVMIRLSPAPRALIIFQLISLGFRFATPPGRGPRPSISAGVRDFTLTPASRVEGSSLVRFLAFQFGLLDCCWTTGLGATAGSKRSGITLRFYLEFVCLRAGVVIFGGSAARRTSSWVKTAKIKGCASRKRAKSPKVRPRCNSLSSSTKI